MHELQEIAERNGMETRSYSGRGMYGKECLGIVCDLRELCQLMIDYGSSSNGYTPEIPRINEDSLGLNAIYYFPTIKFEEDIEEDPEDWEEADWVTDPDMECK